MLIKLAFDLRISTWTISSKSQVSIVSMLNEGGNKMLKVPLATPRHAKTCMDEPFAGKIVLEMR